MREIKFRAWVKNRYGPTWGYTDTILLNEYIKEMQEAQLLLQYTGLKDKNGKEIYEGDVVKFKQYSWIDKSSEPKYHWSLGEIIYAFARYWILVEGARLQIDPMQTLEILGNIYENPELVK